MELLNEFQNIQNARLEYSLFFKNNPYEDGW